MLKPEYKDKDFSRLPRILVTSGLLTKLSNPAIRVYLVILTYANYQTGLSYPTVKTISRLSGINKNLISKALKELILSGLVEKYKGSERFRYRNYYRIIRMPGVNLYNIPGKKQNPRRLLRGENGKFTSFELTCEPVPSNTEYPVPSLTESDTCP